MNAGVLSIRGLAASTDHKGRAPARCATMLRIARTPLTLISAEIGWSESREMSLRPLSQTGLRHIARNASQRPIGEGGSPAPRTVLEAFNSRATTRYLHPTKGWRNLNARRSVAQLITAEIKHGRHWSLQDMAKVLRGVPR